MPSLIDLDAGGPNGSSSTGPWPRVMVDASVWNLQSTNLRTGRWSLLGLWGDAGDGAHGDHGWTHRRDRGRQPGLPGWTLSVGRRASSAGDPAGAHDPRSVRSDRRRPARPAALARSRPLGRALSARRLGVAAPPNASPYRFLPAEGEGLHQIAVGPVHAGIIEPGHFRFTASGETVVRLEQRLGYVHKGIEGLMAGATLERAAHSPAASQATAPSPMRSPSRGRPKLRWSSTRRRARSGCAR